MFHRVALGGADFAFTARPSHVLPLSPIFFVAEPSKERGDSGTYAPSGESSLFFLAKPPFQPGEGNLTAKVVLPRENTAGANTDEYGHLQLVVSA